MSLFRDIAVCLSMWVVLGSLFVVYRKLRIVEKNLKIVQAYMEKKT